MRRDGLSGRLRPTFASRRDTLPFIRFRGTMSQVSMYQERMRSFSFCSMSADSGLAAIFISSRGSMHREGHPYRPRSDLCQRTKMTIPRDVSLIVRTITSGLWTFVIRHMEEQSPFFSRLFPTLAYLPAVVRAVGCSRHPARRPSHQSPVPLLSLHSDRVP